MIIQDKTGKAIRILKNVSFFEAYEGKIREKAVQRGHFSFYAGFFIKVIAKTESVHLKVKNACCEFDGLQQAFISWLPGLLLRL